MIAKQNLLRLNYTLRQTRTVLILLIIVGFSFGGAGCGTPPSDPPITSGVRFVTVTPGLTKVSTVAVIASTDVEPTPVPRIEAPTPTDTPTSQPTATSIPPTATPEPSPTPLPPTPTSIPCGPPRHWVGYVVQLNDTLFSLAQKTHITVDQLKLANCLINDTIFLGQELYLPFIPSQSTRPDEVSEQSTGIVEVFVKNSDNEPVDNGEVTAVLANLAARPDSLGTYTFDYLPPGQEFIAVEAPDYQSDFHHIIVQAGQKSAVEIWLTHSSLRYIYGSLEATIEGRVLINSYPAPEVRVWIWNTNLNAITDGNGWYQFTHAPLEALVLAEREGQRQGVIVSAEPQATTRVPDIRFH